MQYFKHMIHFSFFLLLVGTLAACASTDGNSDSADNMEIYEVHRDGRINVFYNQKLYKEFLALGETPYRLTRIGAGPNGETLVFGLTKNDKKMKNPVAAIELYDGKSTQDSIYGEMVKHNRVYVFSNFKDMNTVRSFGHPNYMYTMIGAGPKGETVVFVLNKKNKKKRPDALIAKYKEHNT